MKDSSPPSERYLSRTRSFPGWLDSRPDKWFHRLLHFTCKPNTEPLFPVALMSQRPTKANSGLISVAPAVITDLASAYFRRSLSDIVTLGRSNGLLFTSHFSRLPTTQMAFQDLNGGWFASSWATAVGWTNIMCPFRRGVVPSFASLNAFLLSLIAIHSLWMRWWEAPSDYCCCCIVT